MQRISHFTVIGIGTAVVAVATIVSLVLAAPKNLEAETGTRTGNASTISDTTASSGSAIKFSAPSGGFQANCINLPSACGYPDTTNTGVPDGVTLTNSGCVTVNTNGAVIQNLYIGDCSITVNADNVTIRNVRIEACTYYPIELNGENLLVEDSEIIGTCSAVTAGLSFGSYTARRMYITGAADGFKANYDVLVEDSYVTGLWETEESHNDGVQAYGGENVTVRHSTFALAGSGAEVFQFNSSNSDWLIEDNLISGGGWVFNGGSVPNLTIRNNRLAGARGYGIGWVDGATYEGNYYDGDGSEICIGGGC